MAPMRATALPWLPSVAANRTIGAEIATSLCLMLAKSVLSGSRPSFWATERATAQDAPRILKEGKPSLVLSSFRYTDWTPRSCATESKETSREGS